MKKILSVMLAIMMLFGALSVSASAAGITVGQVSTPSNPINDYAYAISGNQVVIVFDFGAGKAAVPSDLLVYDADTKAFITPDSVTGQYVMLPHNNFDLKAGIPVFLPAANGSDASLVCSGWMLVSQGYNDTGVIYGHGGNSYWTIPDEAAGKIITFKAIYAPAEPEEDVMATVLGVLMKVFGTIVGILFLDGSASAGVELLEKLLGGIL